MIVRQRRLANGLDGWCDPAKGVVLLAEDLTAAEEARALRQICARLMGDPGGAPDAIELARELAVRPELRIIHGEQDVGVESADRAG